MAKIQVSTVKMTADVEVINVSAYLVAKVVRAHMCAEGMIEHGKYPKQEYNKDTKTYDDVKDANGNLVYKYGTVSVQDIEDQFYPLLNELVEAFGVKDNRV